VLPHADTIYLTLVHANIDGDTRFPEIPDTEWQQRERVDHEADEKNGHDYSFIRLERLHTA
jgi:dihydrofolate reductase